MFLSQFRGKPNPKDRILLYILPEKLTSLNGVKVHAVAFVLEEGIFV